MKNGIRSGLLLRCDGGREMGLGHVFRCLTVARHLAPGRSLIVTRRENSVIGLLQAADQDYSLLPDSCRACDEPALLAALAAERDIPFVLLDLKDNSREYVQALVAAGLFVIDIEDLGPGRDSAHLLIDNHIWPGTPESLYRGQALCGFGPDWALLDPSFRVRASRLSAVTPEKRFRQVEHVVLAPGGSDPSGLTPLVLEQLDRVCRDFRVTVVAGPGASGNGYSSLYHELRVVRGISPLDGILAQAQLAVVSGGITMLESLCLGIPTLVVPQNREQYVNAARFAVRAAVSIVPPPGETDQPERIYRALDQLFDDPVCRVGLSRSAAALVDGGGMERLSGAINYLESTRREAVLAHGLQYPASIAPVE